MADAHTYATAKAGMINLTRLMVVAYGPKNIRCNVVAPCWHAPRDACPEHRREADPNEGRHSGRTVRWPTVGVRVWPALGPSKGAHTFTDTLTTWGRGRG